MNRHQITTSRHGRAPATLSEYVTGFGLSVALTLTAFGLVIFDSIERIEVIAAVVVLALLQLIVQLKFFIHLEHESGPKWNKLIFGFMALVVFIVVAGSLWIMANLDYHHDHDGPKAEQELIEREGILRER